MNNISSKWTLRRILRETYIYIILVLTVIVFAVISKGRFLGVLNIVNILRSCSPTLLMASFATLLMITGHSDMSVGGIIGLMAVIFAYSMQARLPLVLIFVFAVAVGVVAGLINGLLVVHFKITPFVATLASMNIFHGVAKLLVPDSVDLIKGNMPENVAWFAKGKLLLNLPLAFWIGILILIACVIVQKKTIWGKYTIAIGGNRTAAQLSGINATKIVWGLYVLVGIMAAVTGMYNASYMNAGDSDVGIGAEVDVIIAVLLGGTSFYGGKGSVIKTSVAVLVLTIFTKGLSSIGVDSYWATLIKGVLFFGALFIDNVLQDSVKYKAKKH